MKAFSSTKMTNSRQSWISSPATIVVTISIPLVILVWLAPSVLGKLVEPLMRPLLSSEAKLRASILNVTPPNTSVDASELATLREENEELRKLLGDETEERIAAGVIGRPTNLPYDVLVIDKGSDDGVVKDAPVYAGEKLVIGLVAAVYDQSSVVALTTTPGWHSTVYIYGPNIYTTAVGQGGGVARVHVPQGIPLEVGNSVVVPSLSGGIYGTIFSIDSVPSRPEQYGYVATDVPINALRLVAIGKRPLSPVDFETARAVIQETKSLLLEVKLPEGVLIDAGSATSSATSTTATSTEEEI